MKVSDSIVIEEQPTVEAGDQTVLTERKVGEIAGRFVVPSYQRGYRWGRHEVEQLLNDLHGSGDSNYYLQPIVVRRRGDLEYELIDGQQRLTTLFLIQRYIRHHVPTASLGYTLDYETRQSSAEYLENPTADKSLDNIDFFHMHQAEECIHEWFERQPDPALVAIGFYQALKSRVSVIWYEVPSDVDARLLFIRLNVGRIPLSDAELVKALLLSKSERQREVAAQWDSIEHDLRHPDVWAFVATRGHDESTRIGLLLDALAGGRLGHGRPKFATYEELSRRIEQSSADTVWKDVVALHARIMSWFEDRNLYHWIGFLVACGVGLDQLIAPASSMTHTGFARHLCERIRDRLKLTRSALVDLRYQDYESCWRVLLLTNVEAVRRRTESSERYSFAAHSRRDWSLEHIEPQQDTPLVTTEQRVAWLASHRDALGSLPSLGDVEAEKLAGEIDVAIANISGPVFAQLAEKLAPLFRGSPDGGDDEYIHSIANLALLASDDNSVLSNSWFEVKRQHVIDLDRSGKYIPTCTRHVFLKYFTGADAQQVHFWSPQDRDAYLDAILDHVQPFLIPEESDDA